MDINKRLDIIQEIATKSPNLGKTAMMKFLFLLQQVYKVPLNYDFEIYTYGPYSSDVMEDINFAKNQNIISIKAHPYSNYIAYNISVAENKTDKTFSKNFKNEIDELLYLFGGKTAKELELLTTIIFIYKNAKVNSWDCDINTIVNDVHEIKPHFSTEEIKKEYEHLEEKRILDKAV